MEESLGVPPHTHTLPNCFTSALMTGEQVAEEHASTLDAENDNHHNQQQHPTVARRCFSSAEPSRHVQLRPVCGGGEEEKMGWREGWGRGQGACDAAYRSSQGSWAAGVDQLDRRLDEGDDVGGKWQIQEVIAAK